MGDGTATQAGNKRRIQARAERSDGFGDAKRQVFLDHVAGCSNLRRAAAAIGVSTATVHRHRRNNSEFAEQLAQALEAGYTALEAEMIERASAARYEPGADAETVPGPESVDSWLGMHLLTLRKRPGAPRSQPADQRQRATEAELNIAILAKLDILNRRLRAGRPIGFRGKQGTRSKRGAKGAAGGGA